MSSFIFFISFIHKKQQQKDKTFAIKIYKLETVQLDKFQNNTKKSIIYLQRPTLFNQLQSNCLKHKRILFTWTQI